MQIIYHITQKCRDKSVESVHDFIMSTINQSMLIDSRVLNDGEDTYYQLDIKDKNYREQFEEQLFNFIRS